MTPRTRAALRELVDALLAEEDGDGSTPKEISSEPRRRLRVEASPLPPISEADAARGRMLLRRKGIYVE